MLRIAGSSARKILGFALLAVYLSVFVFLISSFDNGWPMFLFFLGALPMAFALKKLGFPGPERSMLGNALPSKKNRIIGFIFIYIFIGVFCFYFPHFDQRWQTFAFFLSGLPLALVLWKLGW